MSARSSQRASGGENLSAGGGRQRDSVMSSGSNGVRRGQSVPSSASPFRAASLSSVQLNRSKPRVMRSGSNTSNDWARNSSRVSASSEIRPSTNGQVSRRTNSSSGRRSAKRVNNVSREEIYSLLFRRPNLEDVRPDAYRLDLSQRKDLQFLYELQHRVDPELVPIKKNWKNEGWERMRKSHIFDTDPLPATQRRARTPVEKNPDGLGTLARFILCPNSKDNTPVRGRRHCSPVADNTTFRVLGDYSSRGKSRDASPALQTGRRHVNSRPADKIGTDLRSRDPLSEEVFPRHKIRCMAGVQMFEAMQPKLTLPPRKISRRFVNPLRTHSASDNDIFGVRKRREHMMRRTHSCSSARSTEPYSSENGNKAAKRSCLSQGSASIRDEIRSCHSEDGRITMPFGEEEPFCGGTPTRRHRINHGRSVASQNGSFAASSASARSWSHTPSRRGNNSGIMRRKSDFTREGYTNDSATEVTEVASIYTDNEQYINAPPSSRGIRVGRARVPGYSITKSNIVFGNVPLLDSPRRSMPRNSQMSPQMHGILSWN